MVRISQNNFPFYNSGRNIREYINLNYNRTLFSPLWYRKVLSFIHTICFNLFPIRPQECVKLNNNNDELSSVSSCFLHDTFVADHQNNGSDQSLTNPEERRQVEHNYYQGHAIDNADEESTDLDEITATSDHTILVHVDKPKNYGTLSSQIVANERLDYMWKSIDVFGEAQPNDIPVRRKLWDRMKSCCSRTKKNVVPRKHLLKNGGFSREIIEV